MSRKKVFIAGALLFAAMIGVAEAMSARIIRSSIVMPEKDKNTFPPETNRKHEDNPDIQTVTINTFDGLTLLGHWYPCEDAERNIVCMHGWHGSWLKDFGDIIDFLHDSKCNILLVDERAQNRSEGKFMGFSLLEKHDCVEWAKWVSSMTSPELPVYLYGVSMGSATVMMASALKLPKNVKGIIADCGFTSPQDIWKYHTHRLHMPYGGLMKLMTEKKFEFRTHAKGTAESSLDALKICGIPVLLVHGSEDHFVPTEMSYRNYEACGSDKELLIIEGAGHAVNYVTDPKPYEEALRRLWAKAEA